MKTARYVACTITFVITVQCTDCPKSNFHFYIMSCYIKIYKTFWHKVGFSYFINGIIYFDLFESSSGDIIILVT